MTGGHKHLWPLQFDAAALKSHQRTLVTAHPPPPLRALPHVRAIGSAHARPADASFGRHSRPGSRAPASKSGRACPPSLWTTKPNQTSELHKPKQYVLRKTSGAEEDNRKEAKEAIEAEAASQDHGHVQDQPEQVLGGVGGGLP